MRSTPARRRICSPIHTRFSSSRRGERDPDELRDRAGVTIVDIRKNPDDRQIPGSQRMDGAALEGATPPFSKDEPVVLYCGSGNSCSRIAASLRERGYDAVALEAATQHGKKQSSPRSPTSNLDSALELTRKCRGVLVL